jgi:hypothetical protein
MQLLIERRPAVGQLQDRSDEFETIAIVEGFGQTDGEIESIFVENSKLLRRIFPQIQFL